MEQQNLFTLQDLDWFGHKHHSVTDAVLSWWIIFCKENERTGC